MQRNLIKNNYYYILLGYGISCAPFLGKMGVYSGSGTGRGNWLSRGGGDKGKEMVGDI